jgi:transcriptional regulator with XRE-family HTH domain
MHIFLCICNHFAHFMKHTLGARLLEERIRLGLTQADLCSMTGVGRNTQAAYEKDKSHPDSRYLITLLHHGFDALYLLTGRTAAETGFIDESLLCEVFLSVETEISLESRSITPRQKAGIIALVYQASVVGAQIDPAVVKKAVALASSH